MKSLRLSFLLLLVSFSLIAQNPKAVLAKQAFSLKNGSFLFSLDSMVRLAKASWTPDGKSGTKEEFTYSPENKVATALSYEWNSAESNWTGAGGYTNSYDDKGNLARMSDLSWNAAAQSWKPYYQTDITYNGAGNKISVTRASWDNNTNDWFQVNIEEYTFDANQNKLSEVLRYRSLGSTGWEGGSQIFYLYNEKNKQTEVLVQNPFNQQWVEMFKGVYSYDSEGRYIQYKSYYWNSPEPGWNLYGKWDWTYNTAGQIMHEYYWEFGVQVSPDGYKTHIEHFYSNSIEGRIIYPGALSLGSELAANERSNAK
jgi:hypothetical protein